MSCNSRRRRFVPARLGRLCLVLALVSTSWSSDDEYSIKELRSTGNIEPQPASTFMDPLPGESHLMPVGKVPAEPQSLRLRRRFWNGQGFEYILFKGQAARQTCYRGLSFFRITNPDPVPVERMKYYTTLDFNFYGDIEDVYFFDGLVLAPSLELFYKWKGQVIAARRVDPQIGCLDIKSIPTQAKVLLDGRYIGLTPIFLPGLKPRLTHVTLGSTGFLSYSQDIPLFPESTVVIQANLFRPVTGIPGTLNLKTLLRENASSPEEYATREGQVRRLSDRIVKERDSLSAALDSLYPAFVQGDKESGVQSAARLRKYHFAKAAQKKTLMAPLDSSHRLYAFALDSLKRMREKLECVPTAIELSGSSLELLEYDEDMRSLPFQLNVRARNLWFTYIGHLLLSPTEDRQLRTGINKARVRVEYLRIPLSDSIDQQYYFTQYGLQVKLDTLLRIDSLGSGFRFPKSIWKSPDSLRVVNRMRACRNLDPHPDPAAPTLAQAYPAPLPGPVPQRPGRGWKDEADPVFSDFLDRRPRSKGLYWAGSALGAGLSATFGILAGTAYFDSRQEYEQYRRAQSRESALSHEKRTEEKKQAALIYGGISLAAILAAGTTVVFGF